MICLYLQPGANAPIENGASEWTCVTRPAQEEVPNSIGELDRLSGTSKRHPACCTTDGYRYNFASGLALLNVRCEEGAVG
jgi:hypothetical protein